MKDGALSLVQLQEGQLLQHGEYQFRLLKEVSSSPVSALWHARESGRRRTVALKIINPVLYVHDSAMAAMREQALRQRKLQHPSLARVWDVATPSSGWQFIILEAFEGASLSATLNKRSLKAETAKLLLKKLFAVLENLHKQKLLHLDLGAHSLFITKEHQLKVLNVGYNWPLYRALEELGIPTPAQPYYAPELLSRKPTPQPAADIFALGCLAYEMLSGQQAYASNERGHPTRLGWLEDNQWQALLQLLNADPRKRPYQDTERYIEEIFTPKPAPEPKAEPAPSNSSAPSPTDANQETVINPAAAPGLKFNWKEQLQRLQPQGLLDRLSDIPSRKLMLGGAIGLAALAAINLGLFWWMQPTPQERVDNLVEQLEQSLSEDITSDAQRQQLDEQLTELRTLVVNHPEVKNRKLDENITAFFMKLKHPELRNLPPEPDPSAVTLYQPQSSPPVPPPRLQVGDIFSDPMTDGRRGPNMVVIPAGSNYMGDQDGQGDDNELPVHFVVIRTPFALSKHEVTFEEYDLFAKATNRRLPDDQGWGRGRRPVVNVSWRDAQAYTQWLSEKTGKAYRLPSEAEWEYAARANTSTAYWWGGTLGQGRAVCDSCGSEWDGVRTAPVGSFPANPWGLHDMNGNVYEWVQDCYQINYQDAPDNGAAIDSPNCGFRVLRGGSWFDIPRLLRSASRYRHQPNASDNNWGFRVARDLNQEELSAQQY
ncbi:SUMF1/EgtB/PvdO family nonheme iron enzyme [Balneatrix alpica]|uniref:SUMF1/EgtB/PvdO family nonheme iron enzyme n=1 Tax=Balneatrix alpica TaxID=75684 RepID=A0ABV5Z6C5_9GAMM|nr:SUMF1/EgtB/PvdO family nonheme iron enzyme [Balneatrix alpica]